MTVHPEVVALLLAAKLPDTDDPLAWQEEGRIDGRPFNEYERHLLGHVMSWADLDAWRHLYLAEWERQAEMADAEKALIALLEPYAHDDDEPMLAILARMPAEPRAEAERLFDVAYPSGYVPRPEP